MARLASIAKAGYYPTPERVTGLIARCVRLSNGDGGKLLDPCCGEGIAAATIASACELESYGVELDLERANAASLRLDHVVAEDFDMVKIAREAFELLWLNPPYDVVQGKRLEHKFLTHCTQFLAPGGLLIYIVPQYAINAKIAAYLACWYHALRAYRFPDPEYAAYKQIVVFGVKRDEACDDGLDKEQALYHACQGGLPLLVETLDEKAMYALPTPRTIPDFYFYAKNLSPEELVEAVKQSGVCNTAGWREHFNPETELDTFRPLMPLKEGHLISLIAAGHVQNIRLERNAERILVKGRTYKDQVENEDEESERVTDRFVTELLILDLEQGEFMRIDDTGKLAAFGEKWNAILLQRVMDSFPPIYNMDYETSLPSEKVRLLNALSPHRPLPRRNVCGLFEAQKHVAAALYFHLQREKCAALVGEMSVGKTSIGTALAALMGEEANPVFVMCPAHLVDKWKREIQEILPGAYVEIVGRISDVARFARTVRARPKEQMAFAICSKEMAKLGSGHEPAYVRKHELHFEQTAYQDANAPRVWDWLETETARWLNSENNGDTFDGESDELGDEDAGNALIGELDEATLQAAYLGERDDYPKDPSRALDALQVAPALKDGYYLLREQIYCPRCGIEIRDAEDRPVDADYFENKKRFCQACRSPLFQMIHLNQRGKREVDALRLKTIRYPIAEYVRRKLPAFFGLFVSDEVHEAKGHATDVGYAMGALAQSCRHTLGMTGTLYGGYASTLFSLLYRLDPKTRREYRWNEMQRFVARYGILEEVTFKGNGNVDDEDDIGVFTAKRRSKTYVRERAGISPELIVRLLNYTVFVQLADLGYDLVPLREHLVEIDLADGHRKEYDQLRKALEKAMDELRANNESPRRLLAAYLQSLLGYCNSGHREEVVRDPEGGVIAVAAALGEDRLYPKEKELLELTQEAVMRGRGVIVYLRQTGTRDISERLRRLIAHEGLPVAVLKSKISSRKREAWIEQQVRNGVKVLITNMELVKTGLDLIFFPREIFYEPNYSVFTMQQALRRPLRLTQKYEVDAYYLVYRDTMESAAVSLIMEKMAAAEKVNGNSLEASLMASQANADDVLSQLGKVLQGTAQVRDLRALFHEKEREANVKRAQEQERKQATELNQMKDTENAILLPTQQTPVANITLTPMEPTATYQTTLF
ncbi:MAG: methyltransferase [Anaerolineae bacterium]|nr:methyltransferase [Anaerolineae bacterium]